VRGGFDIDGLDEVIHGRVRLGVMAFLAGAGAADFGELKTRLSATDGNLSVHLRKLEDADYVAIDRGRTAFATYLEAIRRLLPPD
jgi:DNA-binding MarR family transcriptional regulator